MENKYYPNLAKPITIGNVTFKNRIFAAPMSNPEMDIDSNMRKEDIAFHEYRASGGAASVCIGLGVVHALGRVHTKEITLYNPLTLPSLKEFSKAMHRKDCKAVMELTHGGKFANARAHSEAGAFALSADAGVNALGMEIRAMTDEDCEEIANQFAQGAQMCIEAGIDMILLHAGHGWLIHQFISPSMNHRTDKWGGSLENRMRFCLLVIKKIREVVGPNFPIEFRMSGSDIAPEGYGIEEGVEIAKMVDGLVDIIHVSAGVHENPDVFGITHPSMFVDNGCNVHLAAEVKKHVKTPVATLGGLCNVDMMEEIIASGKADIVEIARQTLADPELPNKAFSGRKDDIITCCRCFTCFYNYLSNRTYSCAFNPIVGNEFEEKFGKKPTTPKKVVVIGGGPGGMEAALSAYNRGHSVELYEKSSHLGGQLLSEQHIPFKAEMYNFVKVLSRRIEASNIKVHLNTAPTPEEIESKNVDAVIVAVGASQFIPQIPGITDKKVVTLEALHHSTPEVGNNIVVLGGGLVGCECAIYLDRMGKKVTIVEMQDDWAKDSYFMHKNAMVVEMRTNNIYISVNTKAKAVTEKGLLCETDGKEVLFEADTILIAAGMKANKEVAHSFDNTAKIVYHIGDCIKPGRVADAVSDAYYKACDI